MGFNEFITRLTTQLALPLPGENAQLKMTSIIRRQEMMMFTQPELAVKSSVLILLYPGKYKPQPSLVVTLRPTYDGVHSGQISLPGGRFEVTDDDLMHTAIRETHEEIGMDPTQITIIGKLTKLFIPPSNYMVQPFVGYTSHLPLFSRQPEEVEMIIEIPLFELLNENNIVQKEITTRGFQISAPAFIIDGTTIWGATAMILSEFKEILQKTMSGIKEDDLVGDLT
jgi:8-oxo-dGTP pyrophosphatase MutT (NUDIX family)